jgi:hypothetical protein
VVHPDPIPDGEPAPDMNTTDGARKGPYSGHKLLIIRHIPRGRIYLSTKILTFFQATPGLRAGGVVEHMSRPQASCRIAQLTRGDSHLLVWTIGRAKAGHGLEAEQRGRFDQFASSRSPSRRLSWRSNMKVRDGEAAGRARPKLERQTGDANEHGYSRMQGHHRTFIVKRRFFRGLGDGPGKHRRHRSQRPFVTNCPIVFPSPRLSEN